MNCNHPGVDNTTNKCIICNEDWGVLFPNTLENQIMSIEDGDKIYEYEFKYSVEFKFVHCDKIVGLANGHLVIWFIKCGTCFNFDESVKPSYNLTPAVPKIPEPPAPPEPRMIREDGENIFKKIGSFFMLFIFIVGD